jgi:hypothetical protein
MYSTEISLHQLNVAHAGLLEYENKFKLKLSGKNLRYVRLILQIMEEFTKFLGTPFSPPVTVEVSTLIRNMEEKLKNVAPLSVNNNNNNNNNKYNHTTETGEDTTKMLSINDFLFHTRVDNFNFFKIDKYMDQSGIVKKVMGYCEKLYQQSQGVNSEADQSSERHRPALGIFQQFMSSLTANESDGRVLVTWKSRTNI